MHGHASTHLFTDSGPLCGVTGPYHWTLIESAVSCPCCRAIVQIRALKARRAERMALAPLPSDGPRASS